MQTCRRGVRSDAEAEQVALYGMHLELSRKRVPDADRVSRNGEHSHIPAHISAYRHPDKVNLSVDAVEQSPSSKNISKSAQQPSRHQACEKCGIGLSVGDNRWRPGFG